MLAFGCGSQTLNVAETDPFDAAQRRIESNAHRALVERAQILLQTSQPNLDELQGLSEQLKQELMESRVSKAGIEPKSRRRMEAALSDIAHRVSMHPIVPTQSIKVDWSLETGQTPFSWPLKHVRIVSHFGLRTDPFGSERRLFHDGVDFSAAQGTLIHSPGAGRVVQAGWRKNGCGLGVTLLHDHTLMSDYCHLSKVLVVQGQDLRQGDLIGEVGDTGRSTGPHLHWSVWKNGRAIDPSSMVSTPRN